MPKKDKKYSYSDAGVDIGKADRLLGGLKDSITSTFSGRVLNDLSSFAGLFEPELKDCKQPVLVSSTDGVGTKLLLAKQADDYSTVGQDLVAMCINDILCCGAVPLFFLDYIACGKINEKTIKEVISSIASSCRRCNTALIGGETAEMPGMYGEDDLDLAGFAVGLVPKDRIISRENVREGDLVVGISSSGVHSNGFSLVRKIIKEKGLSLDAPFGTEEGTLVQHLLRPTKLYFPFVSQLLHVHKIDIHGIAHITGGGFYGNINRILPANMQAVITEGRWPVHPIFDYFMHQAQIEKPEMYHVFNMGIGLVLLAGQKDLQAIERIAQDAGQQAYPIGQIKKGKGEVSIDFQ